MALSKFSNDIKGFHWLDYLLFISTLLVSLGVGLYHSYGQKTTEQYLTGNRKLTPLPVALSIFMSVTSGITVLGLSAEMYFYGTQMWMTFFAASFGYLITVYLFVPMMYNLQLTSMFGYHNRRYGSPALHMICMTVYIIYSLTYMGIAMYAPATALEGVTNFPVWASLLCTGLIALIYTTMGGMKAVVWTDFFQSFILFAGLLIVLVVGCTKVGGLDRVWEISKEGGRINFINMNPDPTERMTFWSIMIGQGITSIAQTSTEQTQIQRYCALPTLKHAKMTVLFQIPFIFLVYLLVNLSGLTVYAYYEEIGCDPYRSKAISSSNQIIPYFLVDAVRYNGFTGLFVAVLFSGGLSTVSSSMNSLAAITWKHILEPHMKNVPESRKTYVTKFTAFLFGFLGVCIGFTMKYLRGNIVQVSISILSGLNGPIAGVVIGGALFPCLQYKGMIVGIFSGIGVFLWINIGQFIYYPHRTYLYTNVENCSFTGNDTALEIPEDPDNIFWVYSLSFLYIGLAGLLTTIVVGLIVSFLTGKQDRSKVDSMTLVSFGKPHNCCLSCAYRGSCQCEVKHDSIDISNEKEVHIHENDITAKSISQPDKDSTVIVSKM